MIETRLLEYFLAIAREQSFTGAAEALHVSQPTLSKQMMDLEQRIGKPLFIRGGRKTGLTEEGMFLRSKAQEIMLLMEQAESGLQGDDESLSGDIAIGCGETSIMGWLTEIIRWMRDRYPKIVFHLYSGASESVLSRLDKGLLDFALVFGSDRQERYDYLPLGLRDHFGLLMRRDDPLAAKRHISMEDLAGLPLIVPSQENSQKALFQRPMNVVATYELIYNATFMVEQGVGCMVCLGGLVDVDGTRPLAFRPLTPLLDGEWSLAMKKYQTFSPAAKAFLNRLKAKIDENQTDA